MRIVGFCGGDPQRQGQNPNLDDDRITINLDSMTDDMEKDGRVVLEGIFFDFDKSSLKPESTPALEVVSAYLNANPDRSFYVVGHTDSKGQLDYNRTLSSDRANAVVSELNKAYGVGNSQMVPFGIGPVSPGTTNSTEEGRARNRRVELVAQD
ncbi:MAG: OmpA family protein [Pseudorhodobacter sp.]